MYILGDIFLRSFYSIYDFDNKKVGLALHPFSKAHIEKLRNPWIFPIIIIVLILGAAAGVAYFLWKRRNETAVFEAEQDNQFYDQIGATLQGGFYENEPASTPGYMHTGYPNQNFGSDGYQYNNY